MEKFFTSLDPKLMIGVGVAVMIAAIFVREKGSSGIEWSFIWGFAGGSSTIGKLIYVGGFVLAIYSAERVFGGGGGFCQNYQKSFIESCGKQCAKTGGPDLGGCITRCSSQLHSDPVFLSQCKR